MKNNVSYKKILIGIITCLVVILVAMGAIVFYFDPFFHYHKPYENVRVSFDNEAYQNAGIARNFDYDSIIVGSSMTKLYKASDFNDAYGCQSVQLTYSGGTVRNSALILNQVFSHKKNDLKYVFWGIDIFALESDKDKIKQDLPSYLYDDSAFTDVSYLFNKTVYEQIIKNHYRGQKLDYDLMWDDEKREDFCQVNAIENQNINANFTDGSITIPDYETRSVSEGVIENIEQNMVPIIEENENVKFVLFIPTYSVIYWNSNGFIYDNMSNLMTEINYLYDRLSGYENVEFHMLPLMPETSNLYMYKDSLHNNYKIAKKVPVALMSNRYLINDDNKEELFSEFYNYVMDFDYKIYTGEKYPFQNEVKLSSFFDMIDDERFTKVILISSYLGELSEEEINELKKREFVPSEYSGGDYFGIYGDENRFATGTSVDNANESVTNKFVLTYSFASANEDASLQIDDVEYVSVPKMLTVLVFDNETGRVVDVGGLRLDTRELTKY